MGAGIEFNQAAFKHGITETDIRRAFANKVCDHPVEGEENKHLLIGFDTRANLLEILYNVIGDQRINVFHAGSFAKQNSLAVIGITYNCTKCRKAWRTLVKTEE